MVRVGLPFEVGTYQLGSPELPRGGNEGNLKLKMPPFLQFGRAQLTELEVKLDLTVSTNASDPAMASYLLDRLVDMRLEGANLPFVDEIGWHKAPREHFAAGQIQGPYPADLPATGALAAGSYTRTIYKRIRFVEQGMADPLAFTWPSAFWSEWGSLRLKVYETAQTVAGDHIAVTAATCKVTAFLLDRSGKDVVIGAIRQDKYLSNQPNTPRPEPGRHQYWRLQLVNDPAMTTFADDLSSITRLSFGTDGYLIHKDRNVSEMVRADLDGYSRENHRPTDAPLTGQKEEFRFNDPIENASGVLHYIPLIRPSRGSTVRHAPDWSRSSQAPYLKMNDDVLAGLPPTVDFLMSIIIDRDPDLVQKAISSVNAFKGDQFRPVGDAANRKREPLRADLR